MSKIGVGIGEDFPADDSKPAPGNGDEPGNAGYAERHEAYRKLREQRRQWRRQWREEWRAHRRAFRHRGDSDNSSGRARDFGQSFHWGHTIVWGVLALSAALVLIALVNFIFSHLFVIAGVVALLALLAAYHRFDPFDLPPHDYSRGTQAPPPEAAR